MPRQIKVRAYLPWWFRLYVASVNTFAYLAGLEVDTDVLQAQARKAVRYREIEPYDEAKE